MLTTQITTNTTKLLRQIAGLAAIAIVAMAFVAAGPAHADSKKGTGGAKGCQIENNGNVETVAVGTRVGIFVCGEDGEWHFGWLINAISAPRHPKVKVVGAGAVRNGVLQTARTAR